MNNAHTVMKAPTLFIYQAGDMRHARSKWYNYDFNVKTGQFARWGTTFDNDPTYAPFPEILDIEVTTKCNGPAGKLCGFCYKSNNPNGYNMDLASFKSIIDKMPWLTQCALGADAQGQTNPDMFDMMAYARSKGIVPNLTIADVSKDVAARLAAVAGAVAVSVYKHAGFDVAFDSVANLAEAGQQQINLHFMVSSKTYDDAFTVVDAVRNDPRLKQVNAIVFLGLKQKGRGKNWDTVTREQYKKLVEYCLDSGVGFGFDSCSAPAFVEAMEGHPNFEQYKQYAEDCEATMFSSYINEKGEFFPCSFTERWVEGGWGEGLNVLEADDFYQRYLGTPANKTVP
ncbi:hypothetical protein RB43ORF169c [Escherichia phage RB43]|uniref:Radical SAM protein n=1 Tax=Escherichia phage RB43 TaxID=2887182 RepID=Q56BM9_9CAUD|nr:hypothetical protein RB43ORF169c [Escherichia phage RB43]AAX78691.1 hypothetical protein RB43ORF169c [Escherichia phage RB43]